MEDKFADIANHADHAADHFRKITMDQIIVGMKEISLMLDVIRKSENKCYSTITTDWETIDQMSLAWDNPVTFSYKSEKETLVNGKNVYLVIKAAVDNLV